MYFPFQDLLEEVGRYQVKKTSSLSTLGIDAVAHVLMDRILDLLRDMPHGELLMHRALYVVTPAHPGHNQKRGKH